MINAIGMQHEITRRSAIQNNKQDISFQAGTCAPCPPHRAAMYRLGSLMMALGVLWEAFGGTVVSDKINNPSGFFDWAVILPALVLGGCGWLQQSLSGCRRVRPGECK